MGYRVYAETADKIKLSVPNESLTEENARKWFELWRKRYDVVEERMTLDGKEIYSMRAKNGSVLPKV